MASWAEGTKAGRRAWVDRSASRRLGVLGTKTGELKWIKQLSISRDPTRGKGHGKECEEKHKDLVFQRTRAAFCMALLEMKARTAGVQMLRQLDQDASWSPGTQEV